MYLEDLEKFRQICPGNAKDLEDFADFLDIAVINLQEAGQNQELKFPVHQITKKIAPVHAGEVPSNDIRD